MKVSTSPAGWLGTEGFPGASRAKTGNSPAVMRELVTLRPKHVWDNRRETKAALRTRSTALKF
jgi:hypothetical protein